MRIQQTMITTLSALLLALPGLVWAHQSDNSEQAKQSGQSGSGKSMEMEAASSPQPENTAPQKAPETNSAAGGFPYVSGGVGDAESVAMESAYGGYSFKLVNVRSGAQGAYVSNVDITVTNEAGETVLETTTNGPWLMADMPAGTYDIEASFDGNTKTKSITLNENADQRLVIDWRT